MSRLDPGSLYGNYAWVRIRFSIPLLAMRSSGVMAHTYLPTYRLCSDAESMRSVWKSYDTSTEDSNTGGSEQALTHFISALRRLVTSRPALFGVSIRMQSLVLPQTTRSRACTPPVTTWIVLQGRWQSRPMRQCPMLLM